MPPRRRAVATLGLAMAGPAILLLPPVVPLHAEASVATVPCQVITVDGPAATIVCTPSAISGAVSTATLPCRTDPGDTVLAIASDRPLMLVANTAPGYAARCAGFYLEASEGPCESEIHCRTLRESEQCRECGWIEKRSCNGTLLDRMGEVCIACLDRTADGQLQGTKTGPGSGASWSLVRRRRYVDPCTPLGMPPSMVPGMEHLMDPSLDAHAAALLSTWDAHSAGGTEPGWESLAKAAEANGLNLYDYLTGAGIVVTSGLPIAFIKDKLADIDRRLPNRRGSQAAQLERTRDKWLEWTRPDRLAVLAESPGTLAQLGVWIETTSMFDPAELEQMPADTRQQMQAVLDAPLPEPLRGASPPRHRTAANAAFLWEHWDEFAQMYATLQMTRSAGIPY